MNMTQLLPLRLAAYTDIYAIIEEIVMGVDVMQFSIKTIKRKYKRLRGCLHELRLPG